MYKYICVYYTYIIFKAKDLLCKEMFYILFWYCYYYIFISTDVYRTFVFLRVHLLDLRTYEYLYDFFFSLSENCEDMNLFVFDLWPVHTWIIFKLKEIKCNFIRW